MAQDEVPRVEKTVALDLQVSSDLITRLANHVVLQISEDFVYLHFYEVIPPLLFGTPEEQKAKIKDIDSLAPRGAARIAIPVAKMPDIIKAITSIGQLAPSSGDTPREEPK